MRTRGFKSHTAPQADRHWQTDEAKAGSSSASVGDGAYRRLTTDQAAIPWWVASGLSVSVQVASTISEARRRGPART